MPQGKGGIMGEVSSVGHSLWDSILAGVVDRISVSKDFGKTHVERIREMAQGHDLTHEQLVAALKQRGDGGNEDH